MNMSDDVVREAEKIGEEGYSARTLTGFTYRLFLCIGLVMALFHIYFLGYSSLEPWILYYTHLGFGLALAYLLYPFSAKSNASRPGAADIGLIVLSVAACAYFIISMNEIVFRIGVSPTPLDLVFSSLVILLVLEMTRRTNGFVLPLIAVLFILYGLYGNILPYSFGGHRGYSFSRLISYLVGMDAMLSTPLATAASFVFLFFLFSSFLASTGAGQFFIDLALGLAGGTRGGPAKVAVIGSALFGMISGSSSANVVASGTFTIPMMIKTGYSPRFSAAVESVASTGGQMTPPILGAAAFIIAELTGTPYLDIALATVIPALLYFTSIYYMIDLEALKLSLMGHKAEDLPNVRSLIVRRGHLLIPILVLLYVMIVMKASVVKAAIFGIYATVLCTFLRRDTRITVNKAVAGIADGAKQAVGLISACATAGLIIGVLNMTGTGLKFAGAVIAFSGGERPRRPVPDHVCLARPRHGPTHGGGLSHLRGCGRARAHRARRPRTHGKPFHLLFRLPVRNHPAGRPRRVHGLVPRALQSHVRGLHRRPARIRRVHRAVHVRVRAVIAVPRLTPHHRHHHRYRARRGDIHRIGIAGLFPWSAAPRRLSSAVLRGGHHADHPRLPDGRDRRRAGPLRIRCAALHSETRPADANLLKPTPG